jgi:hypothetical protein
VTLLAWLALTVGSFWAGFLVGHGYGYWRGYGDGGEIVADVLVQPDPDPELPDVDF